MKKMFLSIITLLCMVVTTHAQNNVGINDDNSSPNASAMLDVYSISKGMLIPRIALTSSTVAAPITNPAASLLVYNTATAGDVTPGYYYWDGTSQWIRLVANSDPEKNFNLVLKSTNATLLKTENMVLASGDIMLTLPTVTSADDGLEITIKNVGTYTDLITIAGSIGTLIDNNDTITLTRWKGRTFIATGSHWFIKEKETRHDNLLEVCNAGSFMTVAEVVAFLNAHMDGPTVVEFGGGTYDIDATQTINLPYPVTFKGISYGETTLAATAGVSGSPLFICETECYFKMFNFSAISNAVGNDAIRCTMPETYHEFKDCYFDGFNKGIVCMNNNDIWVFEIDFANCLEAGIEIASGTAIGGALKISECDFTQCGKGIHLLSGASQTVSIINCTFYNTISGTDIGLLYAPATFTAYNAMFITNNAWNNQGTYMSGFDFTRTDGRDADVFLINNAGMPNQNPHCKINVNNNAATTTITNAGTYYKANWTNGASSTTTKWLLANNKITYLPSNGGDVWIIVTGNISVDNINRVITIGFVKNGVSTTRYGETDLRITTANQPFQFSTVIYVPNIAKTNYLELWVTSLSDGDVVRFQDVHWFADTQ